MEKTINIANNASINISIRILNKEQDEFYEKRKISKVKIEETPIISFKDRIKLFSGGNSFSNTYKKLVRKSITQSTIPSLANAKNEILNSQKDREEETKIKNYNSLKQIPKIDSDNSQKEIDVNRYIEDLL